MTDQPLSAEGERRRSQILQLALREARQHRQRRLIARGSASAGVIAIAALAIATHYRSQIIQTQPQPRVAVVPATQPAPMVQEIQTDSTITDRLTITPRPPRWTVISDHELLEELDNAGQPAGIVSMNGKTILLPRNSVALR